MWQWLILLAVAFAVWRLCQPAGDCVVRVRNGHTTIRGRVAAGKQADIERFMAEQFPNVRRLRIDVHYPRRGRRLRVHIRGRISQGERQLIRNYFTTAL